MEENRKMMEVISVPVIATIVYWIINLIKYATGNNQKFSKFIPLTAAGIGAVIGVLCFLFVPGIFAADNVLTAFVIGGASGLAATGTNQAIKQLSAIATSKTESADSKSENKDDTTKNS